MLRRLLMLVCVSVALATAPAHARPELPQELVPTMSGGWLFLENGNLDKALAQFTKAYETDLGKDYAEVYYSLAMVWWEKRNAQASLRWLDEGIQARKDRFTWKRAVNKEWDNRIEGRRRYIERNFTVAKLRLPDRAAALPPLADPPPRDPLLRQFTDNLAALVSEAAKDGVYNLWLLLPNGTYWVGDDLVVHRGGELNMTRAVGWDIPADRQPLRRSFTRRVEAIEAGTSEAAAILVAARAREKADAAHAETVRNLRPLTYTSVAPADADRVARDITANWPLDSFRLRYFAINESAESHHSWELPELGIRVAFEADGKLRVEGKKKLTESLGADWRTGLTAQPNSVEVFFDGVAVFISVNGLSFGPIEVRRGKPTGKSTPWNIMLSDDASALRAIEVAKIDAAAPLDLDSRR